MNNPETNTEQPPLKSQGDVRREPARLFYFSKRGKSSFADVSFVIISGVIEGVDEADARKRFETSGKGRVKSTDFDFMDLATASRSPNGIVALTIGETHD